jgi:hypothetical protein
VEPRISEKARSMTKHIIDLTHIDRAGARIAKVRYEIESADPMDAHSQAAVRYQSTFPDNRLPRGSAMMTARTPTPTAST